MSESTAETPRRGEERRKPDARWIFPETTYGGALAQNHFVRQWILEKGLCFREHVGGVINSPEFKGEKIPGSIVPQVQIEEPHWRTTVDFWCANGAALDELRSVAPPEPAKLEVFGVS